MRSKLAFLTASLAIGSVANAEPPGLAPATAAAPSTLGYAGLGLEVLIAETLYAGPTVEGARRLGDTPWLVRGMLGGGSLASRLEEGTNGFAEARLGIEAVGCAPGGAACIFGGVDLGFLDETFTPDGEMTMSHRSLLILPRAGVDLGGQTIRLRAAVEYNVRTAAGLQLALLLRF